VTTLSAPSSAASPVARLRTWRATRRKSQADFLAMGAATFAAFVVLLFGFDLLGGSALVERVIGGTLRARTSADYSVRVDQRVKPVRPVVTTAPGSGQSAGQGTATNGRG
jgi:hypothetical protein